jgi:hypothetical protein
MHADTLCRCPRPPIAPPVKPFPPRDEKLRDLVFNHRDANKDGVLSQDEFVGTTQGLERLKAMRDFHRMDRSGDGRVSRDEYVSAGKQPPVRPFPPVHVDPFQPPVRPIPPVHLDPFQPPVRPVPPVHLDPFQPPVRPAITPR